MHFQSPVFQRTQDVTLHSLRIQLSKSQDRALSGGGSSRPWYPSKTSQCSPWNMATLQPKEHQVSLSLDVSNMAFPTEEEWCLPSDRKNMEVDSLAASLQIWDCPPKQNSQGHTQLLLYKKIVAIALTAFKQMLPNQTPHEPIYS